MSTLLDKRAEKVRFAAGEQAKRNVAARLAAQKQRVKDKNAADRKRMQEVRDNGVKAIDIFRKKAVAAEQAAQAQKEDDAPRAEQTTKTEGPLAGRVIGAIHKERFQQLNDFVDGQAAKHEIWQAAYEAWGRVHDKYDLNDEDIQELGNKLAALEPPLGFDFSDLVKIFRARKGELQ